MYFFDVLQKEHSNKDEFSHLMWETQKTRVIKAGSPEKLVDFLYNKGEMDSSYVNVFFATYRTFSSTHEVLDLLINRYSDSLGLQISERTGPEVIKLFSCSTQLSTKLQLLIKLIILINE